MHLQSLLMLLPSGRSLLALSLAASLVGAALSSEVGSAGALALRRLVLEEFSAGQRLPSRVFEISDSLSVPGNNISLNQTHRRVLPGLLPWLRSALLPSGYPHSVPPEYLSYQGWNTAQDICSYLRGIMGTQAVLEGMGVGRADVTSLSATIAWVLRDGASMIGSLLFSSMFSSHFGQNVKSWRFFADCINNVGITLDMLAPLFREHFLAIICLGSVCKALCGVAAGAAGSSIAEHWGIQGNIADVAAKNGAQHTLLSLLGLLVSIRFAKFANVSRLKIDIAATLYQFIGVGETSLAALLLADCRARVHQLASDEDPRSALPEP